MATLFEAYVTNAGKYSEGQLVGETLKFPTTAQEVEALLKRIGVDGVRYPSFCHASKNGCKKAQKSLKLLGFSQRHLFRCSLMASSTLLDTILSFSVLSTAFRKQTFIEFAVPKQSTVQRTQVQNL